MNTDSTISAISIIIPHTNGIFLYINLSFAVGKPITHIEIKIAKNLLIPTNPSKSTTYKIA